MGESPGVTAHSSEFTGNIAGRFGRPRQSHPQGDHHQNWHTPECQLTHRANPRANKTTRVVEVTDTVFAFSGSNTGPALSKEKSYNRPKSRRHININNLAKPDKIKTRVSKNLKRHCVCCCDDQKLYLMIPRRELPSCTTQVTTKRLKTRRQVLYRPRPATNNRRRKTIYRSPDDAKIPQATRPKAPTAVIPTTW